jgi:hypothetical protein
MGYQFLADLVLVVHFAFLAFVMFGGLLLFRWPRVVWLHVPLTLWGVVLELGGLICPLTPLENSLRRRAGESGYAGGFIEHYITSILYPSGLTRSTQVALGVLLAAGNAAIYWLVWRKTRRRPRQGPIG